MNTTWIARLYPTYPAAVRCDFALLALQRLATDVFLDLSTLEAAIKAVSMDCLHVSFSQTHLGSWKLRATPGW